jgi:hypothetical protein
MRPRSAWLQVLVAGLLVAASPLPGRAEESSGAPSPKIDAHYNSGDGVTADVKAQVKPYGTPADAPPMTLTEKMDRAMKKLATKIAGAAGIVVGEGEIGLKEGPGKIVVNKDGVDASVGVDTSVPGGGASARTGLKLGAEHGEASEMYGPEGEVKSFRLSKYVKGKGDAMGPDGKVELDANTEKVIGLAQIGHADPTQRQRIKEAGDITNEFAAPKPQPALAAPAPAPYHAKPLVKDAAIWIPRPKGCSDSEWNGAVRAMQEEFAQMGKPLEVNLSSTEVLVRDRQPDPYTTAEVNQMERHFRLLGGMARLGERKWQAAEQTAKVAAEPTSDDDEKKYWEATPQIPDPDIERKLDANIAQFNERYELLQKDRPFLAQRRLRLIDSEYFYNMESACRLVQSWRGVYYPYYGHIWKNLEKRVKEMESILAAIRHEAGADTPVPDEFKNDNVGVAVINVGQAEDAVKSPDGQHTQTSNGSGDDAAMRRYRIKGIRHTIDYLRYMLGTNNLNNNDRTTAVDLLKRAEAVLPKLGG